MISLVQCIETTVIIFVDKYCSCLDTREYQVYTYSMNNVTYFVSGVQNTHSWDWMLKKNNISCKSIYEIKIV